MAYGIRFQEFPQDGMPWRLDWLGKLSYPGRDAEPLIDVCLTRLVDEYNDPLLNRFVLREESTVRRIRVGQIALLRIGLVYINGIVRPPRKGQVELRLAVHHDQFQLLQFGDRLSVGDAELPLLSPQRYRLGRAHFAAVHRSWLAVAYRPCDEYEFVLIPSTVLFQTAWAGSPAVVRRLVYGELDKIIDPRTSGFVEGQPGTFFVELFKEIPDREAPAVANIAADPVAAAAYEQFRRALVASRVEENPARPETMSATHIKMGLPFSNEATIVARGKVIPFQELDEHSPDRPPVRRFGFLITQITELRVRPAFTTLVVHRKNDGQQGLNAHDPDLPPAWPVPAKAPPQPDNDQLPEEVAAEPPKDQPLPLGSSEDPASAFDPAIYRLLSRLDFFGFEQVKSNKEMQHYQAAPRVPEEAAEFTGSATTGEARNIRSGAVALDIRPNAALRVPVTLDLFLLTLAALSDLGLPFETIAVAEDHVPREPGGQFVNFLPTVIEGMRSWHLRSRAEPPEARAYVVAELELAGSWRYLLEIERKGDEKLALGYLRAHSGERLKGQLLQDLMLEVARANGWRGLSEERPMYLFESIAHRTQPRRSEEAMPRPQEAAVAFATIIATRVKGDACDAASRSNKAPPGDAAPDEAPDASISPDVA